MLLEHLGYVWLWKMLRKKNDILIVGFIYEKNKRKLNIIKIN